MALSAIASYPWRRRWAGKVTSFKGISGLASLQSKLMVEGGKGNGRVRLPFVLGSLKDFASLPILHAGVLRGVALQKRSLGVSVGGVLLWIRGPLSDFSMTFSNCHVRFYHMPGSLLVL